MGVRAALWLVVDKLVAAVEELRDVSANVVLEVESAAWVDILISVQV